MPYICDIETNGLLETATTVHCLSIYDTDTDTIQTYSDKGSYPPIKEGLSHIAQAPLTVWHNGITYDIPVLQKVYPDFHIQGETFDTLIATRLIWPNIAEIDQHHRHSVKSPTDPYFSFPPNCTGTHTLKAWGYRLGILKGNYAETTDWQEWSEQMCEYNRQDVRVTNALYQTIQKQNYSQQALNLEHQFQKIIFTQEQNGFPFNISQAVKYYAQLETERETLTQQLQKEFPPKDKGTYFTPRRDNKTHHYIAGKPIWKPKITPFNPGSRQDITERLKEKYKWTPQQYTPKGTPKVDETVLSSLPYPEAQTLSRYFLVQKRIGQLAEGTNAWLKLVKPDGRIHGHIITNGAITGRCTHTTPNMAQVPAVGVYMGQEFRSLFYAPEDKVILGADASGLELRCLAHYMARYDHGEYAKKILSGDIHWTNTQALRLVPPGTEYNPKDPYHIWARKTSKKFIYAFNYGAGDHKLGSLVDLTQEQIQTLITTQSKTTITKIKQKLKEQNPYKTVTDTDIAQSIKGAQLRATFMKSLPALKTLINQVKQTAKERKYLYGIDRRKLPIRSIHSAFNTLLQSAGAIAVKKATCILWEDLKKKGLDTHVQQAAHVHDEYQLIVDKETAEQVGTIAVEAFRKAGEHFHFRIPLAGEYKIGKNWAETH